MSIPAVLLPLFVEVALTFALLFWMARSRVGAVKSKQVKMADVALGQLNWPPRVQQISNSYHSQFQLPVLFYCSTAWRSPRIRRTSCSSSWPGCSCCRGWCTPISTPARTMSRTASGPSRPAFSYLLAMWAIFAVRILAGLS